MGKLVRLEHLISFLEYQETVKRLNGAKIAREGVKMKRINQIQFNDGSLELQQDEQGNYLLCAVGKIAHNYYYKFNKIDDSKLPLAFEKFNNCALLI